jgi:hypothetical protein
MSEITHMSLKIPNDLHYQLKVINSNNRLKSGKKEKIQDTLIQILMRYLPNEYNQIKSK